MQSYKILFFGGTFDPFHNGHYEILKQAEKLVNPDKVLIVPSYISPLKTNQAPTDVMDRLKMIELAIENEPNWEIFTYEVFKGDTSYTVDTLDFLYDEYDRILDLEYDKVLNLEIYMLIGADQWLSFHKWKDYQTILGATKIIVANRDGMDLNNPEIKCASLINHNPLTILGLKKDSISSTNIRIAPKASWLNEKVLNYINDNGLYAISRIKPLMSEKRFQHSLRVAHMAKQLMGKYCPQKANLAYTAGIYHDIAKEMDFSEQERIANEILRIHRYEHPKVLHGYIGSYLLKTKYLFTNQEILDAISRHTKPYDFYTTEPTLLDKVLYVADKLEPNRTNEDVFGKDIEEFRKLASTNINECFTTLYNWIQENLTKK